MKESQLTNNFSISRIVHGHWRLLDWNFTPQQLLSFTQQAIELGITTFDHADIYGNHECEAHFGATLNLQKGLRNDIQLITKCGIKLATNKFPHRKIKYYDYSCEHIIKSVDNSLRNFGTDYIDLLLLHRPSPMLNPHEVAKAFSQLHQSGKVLHFGVSNFNPQQFNTLNNYLDEKLVTNQVEISPNFLGEFDNGNMDFFLEKGIKPMAWSPLAGGKLMNPKTEKENRIAEVLIEIAHELEIDSLDKVVYAWLLKHPSNIIPIVGSGKIERLKSATEALEVEMSLSQWFRIYNASTGVNLP